MRLIYEFYSADYVKDLSDAERTVHMYTFYLMSDDYRERRGLDSEGTAFLVASNMLPVTSPCNIDPLEPRFYIVKLWFIGACLSYLIFA